MATNIAILASPSIKDPKWPKTEAKPGEELELAATPVNVTSQTSGFEIRNAAGQIIALLNSDSSCKVKWKPAVTPEDAEYKFHALLREKPTAANGYIGVLMRLPSTNTLAVKGTKITDLVIDECFVPKQEKLVVKFKIAGDVPAKGRMQIWGERYPTNKPLFEDDFVPAADNTWKWDGKKNDSQTAAKVGNYISPQFSPYRLRIVVGPDDDSVKEPYAKGLGKATVEDRQFGIIVQKIQIRVQADFAEPADKKYQLRTALAIEKSPGQVTDDGSFAAMGRLPKEDESGRIRVPLATHWGTNQLFDQGAGNLPDGSNLRVGGAYCCTTTKYNIDRALYTRPQIPVEFVVRLRSRKFASAPNTDKNKLGRFEPEAVGPIRLEPFAEDYPAPSVKDHADEFAELYTAGGVHETYWKNALVKIKQANHASGNPTGAPVKFNSQPVFSFWQARFPVLVDGTQDFDLATVDGDLKYVVGSNELTVYLNRTRLFSGSADDLDKKRKDYKEDSTTKIKLRADLTKRGDILWIVRTTTAPAAGSAVNRWSAYPPGTNCHEFYGGVRSKEPNTLFRQDYSTPGGAFEPVIGKGTGAFPYAGGKLVELKPDTNVPDAQRERVEVQAVTAAGNYLGLAGVLFTPSYIAGDCYRLHIVAEQEAYARSFGCVTPKPQIETRTGAVNVWRVCNIHRSLRLADVNTVGLRNVLDVSGRNIFNSPADPDYDTRPHPGDGINLRLSVINRNMFSAFNEWTIRPPVAVTAATNATPVQITVAPDHGMVDGDCIKITGVPGNAAANGTFVVANVAGNNCTIHSAYNLATPSGAGAGVVGNGAMPAAITILDPPTLNVSGASNEAPIKITTSANHNLTTGNQVIVKGVTGNLDANGIFKITKVSDTELTLDDSDGIDADAWAGGGTLRRTNVTNSNPIAITCAANHNLADGNRVYISGVTGNTAANGMFKVTVVDATNLTLQDSDGTASGEYISGGTVQHCGVIDPHRGVNLKQYKTTYETVAGLGNGAVPLNSAQDIQKQFAPFDCYREYLPPGLPAGFRNVARNAIHVLPKGRTSEEAMLAVDAAIKAHITTLNNNHSASAYTGTTDYGDASAYPKLIKAAINDLTGGAWNAFVNFVTSTAIPVNQVHNWIKTYVENAAQDVTLTGGALNIPVYTAGDSAHYVRWAKGKGTAIANAELAALTPPQPSSAQPKTMPAIRWPEYFQHGIWNSARTNAIGLPSFTKNSLITLGFCSPSGWSMFEGTPDDPTVQTFTHEMGHGCHLSHFVVDGSDFNWKQHHLLEGDCLMSYGHTSAYLPKPGGSAGPTVAGTAIDLGWGDRVLPAKVATPPPNPPYRPPYYLSMDTSVANNDPTIAYIAQWNGTSQFDISNNPLPKRAVSAEPCAKCVLKLRGWNEEKLPCAWKHPDLY